MLRRGPITGLLLLALAAIPGQSCGPFFLEAIFISPHIPDRMPEFLNGQLGVIQNTYWKRYLALAYRQIAGPPLSAEERKALLPPSPADEPNPPSWREAAATIGAVGNVPDGTEKNIPGSQWETYSNCLSDAFSNAARTLKARRQQYPAAKAELLEWVNGQNAVFSNCTQQGAMPTELPASAPAWLHKDRAYQVAAAHFYRAEWEPALEGFRSIGSDTASPWQPAAHYLMARTLLRQATLLRNDPTLLQPAIAELRAAVASGGAYGAPARRLLNYVEIRTDPGKTAVRMSDALSQPDADIAQDIIDLSYLLNFDHLANQTDIARKSDLVDWTLTMRSEIGTDDAPAHALARWKATHSTVWLVAALSLRNTPDADLTDAAKALPSGSPAYLTVTLHRLRLAPADDATRTEIAGVLRQIDGHAPRSAINAFTELQSQKAATLNEFLNAAARIPAIFSDDNEEDPNSPDLPVLGGGSTMAGLPVNSRSTPRFDAATAVILNRALPLNEMVNGVLSGKLPKQLRFELAQAAWTRAVLLNRPDTARRLTPVLIEGEPGWKQWLTAYDNASTPDERRVTGLMALMRFPSVRPYVELGSGRPDGFAGYSSYRDNWWCSGDGSELYKITEGMPDSISHPTANRRPEPPSPPSVQLPAFLGQQIPPTAVTEYYDLKVFMPASTYFAREALDWIAKHPNDARDADLTGFAMRVMRNGCRQDDDKELSHRLFQTLQSKYPGSTWAKRYRTWE